MKYRRMVHGDNRQRGEFTHAVMLKAMDDHLWTVEKGTLYKSNMKTMRRQQAMLAIGKIQSQLTAVFCRV